MNQTPHILIIDDDLTLSVITKEYLEAKDCEVTVLHNASDALSHVKENEYDLCLLDVKMPMKDGFTFAEEMRQHHIDIPVIFLTGQKEQGDRIRGLQIGADDYITKPFSMQELYLRIMNVLRRTGYTQETKAATYTIGKYTYHTDSRSLQINNSQERLSEMEGLLLTMFCDQPNRRITREHALRKIWHDDQNAKSRSLSVYINKLRKRLSKDSNIDIINVYGTGYQLVVAE